MFGFQNARSLQFPLNRGTKECRISLGTIQAGEEQMVSAPISGSRCGRLIVSHLPSRQAVFSSPASAPAACFGFSSSSYPRHPLGGIPFSSWSLLSWRTSYRFFTFCSKEPCPACLPRSGAFSVLIPTIFFYFLPARWCERAVSQEHQGNGWHSPVRMQSDPLLYGG